MDHCDQNRRAQLAELQVALKVALEKLDELEKRLAARKIADYPANSNRIAYQIAIGMTKAGMVSEKS
jgi:hypothetical protein